MQSNSRSYHLSNHFEKIEDSIHTIETSFLSQNSLGRLLQFQEKPNESQEEIGNDLQIDHSKHCTLRSRNH